MQRSWGRKRIQAVVQVGVVLVLWATCVALPMLAQTVTPRWSWQESVEPLDILEYVKDLPYEEWVEIDELTVRRLFEDLIGRACAQMEIEGGHFEDMLRERLFYFTPEREYYYPPYEEDISEREALFPVKIMRERNERYNYDIIYLKLGRFSDDERELKVVFRDGGLYFVELGREQYYPGETGPKKNKILTLGFGTTQTKVLEKIFNRDNTIFSTQMLFEYARSNSEPVVDNTTGELALDLSGVEILFDLPYQSWRIYDPMLFQTYNSLVNICKIQLGLTEEGEELERLLWPELFYFDNADYFGAGIEFFNAKRLYTFDASRERFLFNGGNAQTLRTLDLVLSKDFGNLEAGYDWGIENITLTRNVLISGSEVGEERKILTFNRVAAGFEMELWVTVRNAAGTVLSRERLGEFSQRP